MKGGARVTVGQQLVASGGDVVMNGVDGRRARGVALLGFVAVGLAFAIVNAASELDERDRLGRPVEPWEPWVWEFTSLAGFLLIAPFIMRLSQRLWPPRLSWPRAAALFVILSGPASIVHVAAMISLREVIYTAAGDDYHGAGTLIEVLLYEYRKDLITYALLLVLPHVAARLLETRLRVPLGYNFRLEVRDGSRTRWLAATDIEWAQAAGNYVELHGAFGTLLHRRTLGALENELSPHGFVRIHRSRLVRTAAIKSILVGPSGDFEVVLESGATLLGSRRFRANVG